MRPASSIIRFAHARVRCAETYIDHLAALNGARDPGESLKYVEQSLTELRDAITELQPYRDRLQQQLARKAGA